MKYSLFVFEEVYQELENASKYYNEKRPGLESELFDEWLMALKRLQTDPEIYQKKKKNLRQAMLERFPFLVVFEIIESTVVVYRFIHVRRNVKKRYPKRKSK